MANVRTVNLFQKGIFMIHSIKEGHNFVTARHHATGLEGEGRNDQEAYDDLVKKLKVMGPDGD